MRVEGKPELLKFETADDIFNMIWEIDVGQRTNNLISTHAHQRRTKHIFLPNISPWKMLVIENPADV